LNRHFIFSFVRLTQKGGYSKTGNHAKGHYKHHAKSGTGRMPSLLFIVFCDKSAFSASRHPPGMKNRRRDGEIISGCFFVGYGFFMYFCGNYAI
jgi:hypothetical protein